MLEELKVQVCQANLALVAKGLVIHTWGNVSGIDPQRKHMVIKPSGVPYEGMCPDQMVVLSLATSKVVEGKLNPSSDTPTHLELYRAFPTVGGIVHTHSMFATSWAQARKEIPPLGTTQCDYFHGPVPVTRLLSSKEIQLEYEANTGKVIVERYAGLDPMHFPAVLVADHGPFSWGATPTEAVFHAEILEFLANMACRTLQIDPYPKSVSSAMLDKHFFRKHGPNAYYGQKKE